MRTVTEQFFLYATHLIPMKYHKPGWCLPQTPSFTSASLILPCIHSLSTSIQRKQHETHRQLLYIIPHLTLPRLPNKQQHFSKQLKPPLNHPLSHPHHIKLNNIFPLISSTFPPSLPFSLPHHHSPGSDTLAIQPTPPGRSIPYHRKESAPKSATEIDLTHSYVS